jgi:hypothetical protein
MRHKPLPYSATMFATSMLFAMIYIACVVSWSLLPDLPPHAVMLSLFPQVELLTGPTFLYGLVCAVVYGSLIAAIFVSFYKLWPHLAAFVWQQARLLARRPND